MSFRKGSFFILWMDFLFFPRICYNVPFPVKSTPLSLRSNLICQEGIFLNSSGLGNSDNMQSRVQVQQQSLGPLFPGLVNLERNLEMGEDSMSGAVLKIRKEFPCLN